MELFVIDDFMKAFDVAEKFARKVLKPYYTWDAIDHIIDEAVVPFFGGVRVFRYNDLYMYNYMESVQRFTSRRVENDEILRGNLLLNFMRGLVLDSNGEFVALPFNRFFDHDDPLADPMDWIHPDCVAVKMHDGVLLNVFHHNDEWIIATRTSIPAEEYIIDAFHSLLGEEIFERLNKSYCYAFELVFPKDSYYRGITSYEEPDIYLINYRETYRVTIKEQNRYYVATEARRLGVKFPERQVINSLGEVMTLVNELRPDEKGFVVGDELGHLIMVKNPKYLRLKTARGMSKERFIRNYLIAREASDDNFINSLLGLGEDINDKLTKIMRHTDLIYEVAKEHRIKSLQQIASSASFNGGVISEREERKIVSSTIEHPGLAPLFFRLYDERWRGDKKEFYRVLLSLGYKGLMRAYDWAREYEVLNK